ncbi:MAG TPA: SOS response-associated peptidase family protein [Rhizomicrobium sp.]|jgi:putative SOS response-associated peptidase YedK|nr:SOS response-associated peptidase family protein [Rhizomicrobium sp.]
MCGKFTAMYAWRDLHYYSDLLTSHGIGTGAENEAETVLATPMRTMPVVCLDASGQRITIPMRWGWIDVRAQDPRKKPGMMHARSETLDVKPLWKHAFANGRGVVWADSFNVGEEVAPNRVRQWNCRRADGRPLGIAVLWERWEHPRHGALHVFVPVTTESPPSVRSKDDRFPVLLDSEDGIALWLGESSAPVEDIKTLFRIYEGELIVREEKNASPRRRTTAKAQRELF